MTLFKNKKQPSYTVIIGCGRLGANLANTLSGEGENVLILDKEKDSFRKRGTAPSLGRRRRSGCHLRRLRAGKKSIQWKSACNRI